MNRARIAIIIGVAVLALGAGVVVIANHSTNSATASSTTTPTTDTVSVSGTGSVEGVPDTLVANLHVHAQESTVQDALNASSTDANKVIGALTKAGVARSDVKSTSLSLNQSYDSHGNPDGYDSGESLTVRIHPLSKVGQILTAASTSAGNSVSINGLSFDIADNSTLLSGARQAAFDNAKAAAQQYATLGGRTLSHVVSIKAQVHNASPIRGYGHAATRGALSGFDKEAASVPIRPGQKKISVTVQVVWALS